jgi:hypothetical protein
MITKKDITRRLKILFKDIKPLLEKRRKNLDLAYSGQPAEY